MPQKGFSVIFFILIIAALCSVVIAGFFLLKNKIQTPQTEVSNNQAKPNLSPLPKAISSNQPGVVASISPVSTTDWQTLNIDSCKISLKYPKGWDKDVYEEPGHCSLALGPADIHTKSKFILVNVSVSNPEIANSLRTQPKNADVLVVDGVEGYINKPLVIEGVASKTFRILKGQMNYTGQIRYSTGEKSYLDQLMVMLTSLKFTGDENSYKDDHVDFAQHVSQNTAYSANASVLASAVLMYKEVVGKLPDKLEQLLEEPSTKNDIERITNTDLGHLDKYTYTKIDDKRFTISVKLNDGSDYTLDREAR